MSDVELLPFLFTNQQLDIVLVRSLVVGIGDHLCDLVMTQSLRRDAVNLQDDVAYMQVS